MVFMDRLQDGSLRAAFPAAIATCCRVPERGLPVARLSALAPQAPGLAHSIDDQNSNCQNQRDMLHVVQVCTGSAYGFASRGRHPNPQDVKHVAHRYKT